MSVIPLYQPDISGAEIQAVIDALRSGRLTAGPRRDRFEDLCAERCGCGHGVAVSCGTAALHLVLRALDIGPGDEVITTPLSFIASANSILYVGATPVFVDIDPRSLNLDPAAAEAAITSKTKAILAVELFGDTTHIDQLAQLARSNEITLIEDGCEALGGVHCGRPVGSIGRAGVFGFYSNKQVTTGEGGMIVTDDDRLAALCRSMRNHGRVQPDTDTTLLSTDGAPLIHDQLGYNYRVSELACALGIVQMERLDQILSARRTIASLYMQKLRDMPDLILPTVEVPQDRSWFAFVVRLDDQYTHVERDRVIAGMSRHDIGVAAYFPCIHLQPYYRQRFGYDKGTLPIAESVSQRCIALPFYNRMDETQVELVVHTLRVMIQREQLLRRDE